MLSIEPCPLPENGLLSKYSHTGAYTDCYQTEVSGIVTHAEYVGAFYTTWLFKLERMMLNWMISRPSSDAQARQLANGSIEQFAAWYVEDRCENQLLMSDFRDRTRSWLMVEPMETGNGRKTRLYFGSAVVPIQNDKKEKISMGPGFWLLLGFHKVYSVLLLYSASARLNT